MHGEFPGGPVVRIWHFHCRAQVQSLVRELRSHKPREKKLNQCMRDTILKRKERGVLDGDVRGTARPLLYLHFQVWR